MSYILNSTASVDGVGSLRVAARDLLGAHHAGLTVDRSVDRIIDEANEQFPDD